jgi:formate hydrogenlyase subunit 6/NADH:ubiquinone oxidoreductase subunit I
MMGVTPLLEVSHTSLPLSLSFAIYHYCCVACELCAKEEEKCLSMERVIQLKWQFLVKHSVRLYKQLRIQHVTQWKKCVSCEVIASVYVMAALDLVTKYASMVV